jgi:hypothetical protein
MKTTISLLYVFTAAIIIAFIITEVGVPLDAQILALGLITLIIAFCIVVIYYCRKGESWSFAGASILGAAECSKHMSMDCCKMCAEACKMCASECRKMMA